MSSFEQMMTELRAEYLTTLPERIRDVEVHFEQKDYGALYNDFHKLKGSGKTYGIGEITLVAEIFEKVGYAKQNGQTPKLAPEVWIPKSVALLKAILKSRTEQKPFDVEQNADFQEARRLSAATAPA